MIHLNIQQGNTPENVKFSVINKLYQIALAAETNENILVSLSGSITPRTAYYTPVSYLREHYGNTLTINITNDDCYIEFADPVFLEVCSSLIGDGYGVLKRQIATTNLKIILGSNGLFLGEHYSKINDVTTLEDFLYFTEPNSNLTYGVFIEMPSGKTYNKITFPNSIIRTGGIKTGIIKSSSGKITINEIDWNGVQFDFPYETGLSYQPCNIFMDVLFEGKTANLPVLTTFPPLCRGNTELGTVVYPEGVQEVGGNFLGCKIDYLEFPTTLARVQNLCSLFCQNNTSGKRIIVFKSLVKHLTPISTGNNLYKPTAIYVPDSLYNTYMGSTDSDIAKFRNNFSIYKISLLPEEYYNYSGVGTITAENKDSF